ncbi:oligomeric Golgi complex subunit 6 [Endogone sp. FLAS-F59071]|nr:oligomeric Golgi complex subunit 6 [Endogone sp. FLAS-F59071]|eukprot:RUS17455.1 oligomeric Golgi complex subunit 6 [Endogone sp. FLAS-F59071]
MEEPELNLTPSTNNPLSVKLNKILSSSLDDQRTKHALEALSDFYHTNTPDARRNLRGDIERRAMENNRRFLEAFGKVNEQLLTLENEMATMQQCCGEMKSRLDSANTQTSMMLEQADSLKIQSKACETRKIIIDAFLERFTLSNAEVAVLCSPSAAVGSEFFDALKHLQQIHGDCKALLISEHQKAGLEIMESMALYQDTAYDKLFRWTQYECRSFGRDSLEVGGSMKNAMKALKQRPVLFQSCLDELVHIRRNAIVRAFVEALTRGGPGGTPRPIELHAHDPLRYVGDMLAWLHQAVAGEREFLEALFDYRGENATNRARRSSKKQLRPPENTAKNDDTVDGEGVHISLQSDESAILELLDRALEGTSRPLKTRVEQVLVSQPGAITSYRISNLIQFYSVTIGKMLGERAELSKTLHDITEAAYRVFFETLSAQAARLLRFLQTPSPDLSPPPAVKETVLQLVGDSVLKEVRRQELSKFRIIIGMSKEIMSSYDSSFLTNDASPSTSHPFNDFSTILDAVVDPLLQMCELGAKQLNTFDRAVHMINCMHHVQVSSKDYGESALVLYSFTEARARSLETEIETNLGVLVKEQYQTLLRQSGLAKITQALDSKDAETVTLPISHFHHFYATHAIPCQTPLSTLPGLDGRSLTQILSTLDPFLVSVTVDSSSRLSRLSSSRLLRAANQRAVREFVRAYQRISEAVEDPTNEYEYPATILPRTVDEVETILLLE